MKAPRAVVPTQTSVATPVRTTLRIVALARRISVKESVIAVLGDHRVAGLRSHRTIVIAFPGAFGAEEEILSRYLNTAYFGAGVYGVDTAAKRYFCQNAKGVVRTGAGKLRGPGRRTLALA